MNRLRKISTRQSGFTLVEVLLATVLLVIALVPMMEALQTGLLVSREHQQMSSTYFQVQGRMEEVLAEPFSALFNEAAQQNDKTSPAIYSDPVATPERKLVYLSFYDFQNSDGDNDPFTIEDPNNDGDNNPFTGGDVEIELLWLRVEIENSIHVIETLVGLH